MSICPVYIQVYMLSETEKVIPKLAFNQILSSLASPAFYLDSSIVSSFVILSFPFSFLFKYKHFQIKDYTHYADREFCFEREGVKKVTSLQTAVSIWHNSYGTAWDNHVPYQNARIWILIVLMTLTSWEGWVNCFCTKGLVGISVTSFMGHKNAST